MKLRIIESVHTVEPQTLVFSYSLFGVLRHVAWTLRHVAWTSLKGACSCLSLQSTVTTGVGYHIWYLAHSFAVITN